MAFILSSFFFLISDAAFSQSNIFCTNPAAEAVLKCHYDPNTYRPPVVINQVDSITQGLNMRINPDSLYHNLLALASFQTRNSGSDTVSPVRGIGAARRWVYQQFLHISNQNNHRLLPAFLQFDSAMCTIQQHRDVFAVLPGLDTSDHSFIIIESHLDSRCAVLCDTDCVAEGADDNASAVALVIELARVMSHYSFDHSIVFLANTGEEQGLIGANAFVSYVLQKNMQVKAVLNNDIVSGILCGHTSSPPSCSPFGNIDSTTVRIFSFGGFDSPDKAEARYIKLQYDERLKPIAKVPMLINLMTAEDRAGRGGDHIPFRLHGFSAVRFTSANENGNANVTDPNYIDDQHTSRDVVGYDTNGDGAIDSFLVDKDYLSRNSQINGEAAAMAAMAPPAPTATMTRSGNDVQITISANKTYPFYKVGIRSFSWDWDSLIVFSSPQITIHLSNAGLNCISTAVVDSNGVESFFSDEQEFLVTGVLQPNAANGIYLQNAQPNPFDEATMISVLVEKPISYQKASIRIVDSNGQTAGEMPIVLKQGMDEVVFHHGKNPAGTYVYQLVIDGNVADAKQIVLTR